MASKVRFSSVADHSTPGSPSSCYIPGAAGAGIGGGISEAAGGEGKGAAWQHCQGRAWIRPIVHVGMEAALLGTCMDRADYACWDGGSM